MQITNTNPTLCNILCKLVKGGDMQSQQLPHMKLK